MDDNCCPGCVADGADVGGVVVGAGVCCPATSRGTTSSAAPGMLPFLNTDSWGFPFHGNAKPGCSEVRENRCSAGHRRRARSNVAETEGKLRRQGRQNLQPANSPGNREDRRAGSNGRAHGVASRATMRIGGAGIQIEATMHAVQLRNKKKGREQRCQNKESLRSSRQSDSQSLTLNGPMVHPSRWFSTAITSGLLVRAVVQSKRRKRGKIIGNYGTGGLVTNLDLVRDHPSRRVMNRLNSADGKSPIAQPGPCFLQSAMQVVL